ncbi:hypothetical protein DIE01_16150 [Burkholderia sp. Bp8990]|nr:hypothetical protein DIE01_16150 [Burkholderia sp. Bp8990]
MLDRLVDRIIARAKRTPYFHLDGYMERYWLRQPPGHDANTSTYDRSKTGIGARVHRILRSDNDRHLHDHPWPTISIILRGGYWEILPAMQCQDPSLDPYLWRRVWRGPGSIVFRRAHHRHRIELPDGRDSWSLFIMGRYTKQWGFYTREGFVYWRTYLGEEA